MENNGPEAMIIDDEQVILDITAKLLEELGFHSEVFIKPKEAIECYRNNWQGIDLVIIDFIMPDMTGGEVFDILREINPDVKVLICSGFRGNQEIQNILDRGALGIITKPLEFESFSKCINQILGVKKISNIE